MEPILELAKLDFSYVFIAVFVILIGVKTIVSLFEWLIGKLGLETKRMRKRRRDHNLLIQTSQNLSKLQEQHDESVKQSSRHDEIIKADISALNDSINGIANTLSDMQEKIDHTEMTKLKGQILSYYRKYKDIGEWDAFESDVFWGLYDSYISHGGNSFVRQEIEPVMRNLDVKS